MHRIFPQPFWSVLLFAFLPIGAHADTLNFTLDQTITFSLPVPLNGAAVNADDLRFLDFPIDFNGHPTTAQLDLFSSAIGGGFNLTYSFPGGPGHFISHGVQLFSGTTDDPTILTGSFDLNNGGKDGIDTLTITSDAAAPTPEPPTVALLTTGALGLFLLSKNRTKNRTRNRGQI
jgi:hypothetical protein